MITFSLPIRTGAFLVLTIIGQNLKAQVSYKELVLDTLSQRANTWCWAASAEMVIKFFKPELMNSVLQIQMIKEYSNQWSNPVNCSDCFGRVYTFKVKTQNGPCIFAMTQLNNTFRNILLKSNFKSEEIRNTAANPINWSQITALIDACRPFILLVDPTNGQGISSNHYVVGKGYYVSNDSIKYVIANDPWSPCSSGRETIFPYSNFLNISDAALTGLNIHRVISIMKNIIPDEDCDNGNGTNEDCYSCDNICIKTSQLLGISPCILTELDGPISNISRQNDFTTGVGGGSLRIDQDTLKEGLRPKTNWLINKLVKNSDKIIGFQNNIIKREQLDSFVFIPHNYATNVKYLSVDKLKKHLCFFRTLNKVQNNLDHAEKVVEVVSGTVSPDIVSAFQQDKLGNLRLVGITDFTFLQERINVKTIKKDTSVFVLSNLKGAIQIRNGISYELVKIPPFFYEFFMYSLEGKNMMTPCVSYPELGLSSNVAYPEKKVVKRLRKVANQLLDQNRTSFFERIRLFFQNLFKGKKK